jgi:hypothetical protein
MVRTGTDRTGIRQELIRAGNRANCTCSPISFTSSVSSFTGAIFNATCAAEKREGRREKGEVVSKSKAQKS